MAMIDELRAKFESAISSFDPNEFKAIFSLERGEDGGYKDEAILALWNGYRLGYASRDAEVEALKAECDALRQRIESAPVGEIICGRANRFGGYHVEIAHDVSWVKGKRVRLVVEGGE